MFVNVSESEGIPVSIMEALAAGVPVLATDVGGTSELVGENNGILLPPNPTAGQVGAGIADLLERQKREPSWRRAIRAEIRDRYDARENYSAFCEDILKLVDARTARVG